MKRNKLFQALLMTGVLLLTGCGETPSSQGSETEKEPTTSVQEEVKLTGLTIHTEGNVNKVEVNKTLQLTVTATPESADNSVTWSSSNEEYATVSETGLVTGVKEGAIIIKATSKVDPSVYKEIALTIIAEKLPDPESITITLADGATEVAAGKTLQASATVSPEKAEQGVNWSSSDPEVATVTPAGLIRGVKEGKATITATSKKVATVKASVEVTITKAEIATTVEWDKQAYADHATYISSKKNTPLKVKGKVTYITPEFTDENGDVLVSYFMQNGKEGFFIENQNAILGKVELGKVYEVGGMKGWNFSCNSINKVEHFKALTEEMTVEATDLTPEASLAYNDIVDHMSSKVTLKGKVTSIPQKADEKGFSLKVANATSSIEVRCNPRYVTAENTQAIFEKFSSLLLSQEINISGYASSFGYGKPASHIVVTSPEDIQLVEMDDLAKVNVAVNSLILPHTLDKEPKIELPKTLAQLKDTSLTWTSDNEAAIDPNTGNVTHLERDADVKLTVTAKAGTKEASKSFIVTVLSVTDTYYSEVARLDFEDALPGNKYGCSATKNGYKVGNVNLGGHDWEMNSALIGGDERDRRDGVFAARVQTQYENGITLLDGVNFDTIEFIAGIYGENTLCPVIKISYAVGDAKEFTVLPRDFVLTDYPMVKIRTKLPVAESDIVRVRISAVQGTGQRFNVDNIRLLKTNA